MQVAMQGRRMWLYTFACNARARRFYEQHGFVPIAFGFESVWQLDDVKYRWPATYHAEDE